MSTALTTPERLRRGGRLGIDGFRFRGAALVQAYDRFLWLDRKLKLVDQRRHEGEAAAALGVLRVGGLGRGDERPAVADRADERVAVGIEPQADRALLVGAACLIALVTASFTAKTNS